MTFSMTDEADGFLPELWVALSGSTHSMKIGHSHVLQTMLQIFVKTHVMVS